MHKNKMSFSLDHSNRSKDESENISKIESIADDISSIEGHDSDSSGEDMMVETNDSMSMTAQDKKHCHLPPAGSICATPHTLCDGEW